MKPAALAVRPGHSESALRALRIRSSSNFIRSFYRGRNTFRSCSLHGGAQRCFQSFRQSLTHTYYNCQPHSAPSLLKVGSARTWRTACATYYADNATVMSRASKHRNRLRTRHSTL